MKKAICLISYLLLFNITIFAQQQKFTISGTKSYVNGKELKLENPQEGMIDIQKKVLSFGIAGVYILNKVVSRTAEKICINGSFYGTANYKPAYIEITKRSITISTTGSYHTKSGIIEQNAKYKLVYNTSLLKL